MPMVQTVGWVVLVVLAVSAVSVVVAGQHREWELKDEMAMTVQSVILVIVVLAVLAVPVAPEQLAIKPRLTVAAVVLAVSAATVAIR